MGGESNGKIIGTMESYAENFSWSCSLPDFTKHLRQDLNERQNTNLVLPTMKTARIYAASASYDNSLYLLGK